MSNVSKALKRKVNKVISDISSDLVDTGEKVEDIESQPNDIYYPQIHFEGDELKGLEVGTEVQLFAVGTVSSKHESENYKGGSVEVRKILVVPKDGNPDHEDDE